MTTNKTHPHAEILRALADGVPAEEFECRAFDWEEDVWRTINSAIAGELIITPGVWCVRRKPQYIMVNGFKVPKPLDVITPFVFWPYITCESFWDSASNCNSEAQRAFKRGCAHSTTEAAIAHAKAMLGIDPEYFK